MTKKPNVMDGAISVPGVEAHVVKTANSFDGEYYVAGVFLTQEDAETYVQRNKDYFPDDNRPWRIQSMALMTYEHGDKDDGA